MVGAEYLHSLCHRGRFLSELIKQGLEGSHVFSLSATL
jgi:hypothetical protein